MSHSDFIASCIPTNRATIARDIIGSMDSLDNRSLRVLGDSLIGHFSDITIDIISGVGDCLGPAIRESNRVGARPGTKSIIRLRGSEGRARVVIIDSIVVGEGKDLSFWLARAGAASEGSCNLPGSMKSVGEVRDW